VLCKNRPDDRIFKSLSSVDEAREATCTTAGMVGGRAFRHTGVRG